MRLEDVTEKEKQTVTVYPVVTPRGETIAVPGSVPPVRLPSDASTAQPWTTKATPATGTRPVDNKTEDGEINWEAAGYSNAFRGHDSFVYEDLHKPENNALRDDYIKAAKLVWQIENEGQAVPEMTAEAWVDYGYSTASWFNNNTVSLGLWAKRINSDNVTPAQKQAFGYLLDVHDEVDMFSSASWGAIGRNIVDPVTLAGFALAPLTAGGSAAGATAASQAAKQGIRAAVVAAFKEGIKRTATVATARVTSATIKGGLQAGAREAVELGAKGIVINSAVNVATITAEDRGRQNVRVDVGVQDEVSNAQSLMAAGMGFGFGEAMAAGPGSASYFVRSLRNPTGKPKVTVGGGNSGSGAGSPPPSPSAAARGLSGGTPQQALFAPKTYGDRMIGDPVKPFVMHWNNLKAATTWSGFRDRVLKRINVNEHLPTHTSDRHARQVVTSADNILAKAGLIDDASLGSSKGPLGKLADTLNATLADESLDAAQKWIKIGNQIYDFANANKTGLTEASDNLIRLRNELELEKYFVNDVARASNKPALNVIEEKITSLGLDPANYAGRIKTALGGDKGLRSFDADQSDAAIAWINELQDVTSKLARDPDGYIDALETAMEKSAKAPDIIEQYKIDMMPLLRNAEDASKRFSSRNSDIAYRGPIAAGKRPYDLDELRTTEQQIVEGFYDPGTRPRYYKPKEFGQLGDYLGEIENFDVTKGEAGKRAEELAVIIDALHTRGYETETLRALRFLKYHSGTEVAVLNSLPKALKKIIEAKSPRVDSFIAKVTEITEKRFSGQRKVSQVHVLADYAKDSLPFRLARSDVKAGSELGGYFKGDYATDFREKIQTQISAKLRGQRTQLGDPIKGSGKRFLERTSTGAGGWIKSAKFDPEIHTEGKWSSWWDRRAMWQKALLAPTYPGAKLLQYGGAPALFIATMYGGGMHLAEEGVELAASAATGENIEFSADVGSRLAGGIAKFGDMTVGNTIRAGYQAPASLFNNFVYDTGINPLDDIPALPVDTISGTRIPGTDITPLSDRFDDKPEKTSEDVVVASDSTTIPDGTLTLDDTVGPKDPDPTKGPAGSGNTKSSTSKDGDGLSSIFSGSSDPGDAAWRLAKRFENFILSPLGVTGRNNLRDAFSAVGGGLSFGASFLGDSFDYFKREMPAFTGVMGGFGIFAAINAVSNLLLKKIPGGGLIGTALAIAGGIFGYVALANRFKGQSEGNHIDMKHAPHKYSDASGVMQTTAENKDVHTASMAKMPSDLVMSGTGNGEHALAPEDLGLESDIVLSANIPSSSAEEDLKFPMGPARRTPGLRGPGPLHA